MVKLKKAWNTFMFNWWDIYRHICYWFECKLFCLNRSQISLSLTLTISLSSSLPHKNVIPSQTHLPGHNKTPKLKKSVSNMINFYSHCQNFLLQIIKEYFLIFLLWMQLHLKECITKGYLCSHIWSLKKNIEGNLVGGGI